MQTKNEKLDSINTTLTGLLLQEKKSTKTRSAKNPNTKLGRNYRIDFDLPFWADVEFDKDTNMSQRLYWVDPYKYPSASLFKYKSDPFVRKLDPSTPLSKISFRVLMMFMIQGLSKKVITFKETESKLSSSIYHGLSFLKSRTGRVEQFTDNELEEVNKITIKQEEMIQSRNKLREKIIIGVTIIENMIKFIKLSE